MKIILIFITVAALARAEIVTKGGVAASQNPSENILPKKLSLIAKADGKSFFMDSTYRDWWDSREYCRSFGMRLASITTEAQWNAIKTGLEVYGKTWCWTAGRESYWRTEYLWDDAQVHLPSFVPFFKFSDLDLPYHSCIQVVVNTDNPQYHGLYYGECNSSAWVLCES